MSPVQHETGILPPHGAVAAASTPHPLLPARSRTRLWPRFPRRGLWICVRRIPVCTAHRRDDALRWLQSRKFRVRASRRPIVRPGVAKGHRAAVWALCAALCLRDAGLKRRPWSAYGFCGVYDVAVHGLEHRRHRIGRVAWLFHIQSSAYHPFRSGGYELQRRERACSGEKYL